MAPKKASKKSITAKSDVARSTHDMELEVAYENGKVSIDKEINRLTSESDLLEILEAMEVEWGLGATRVVLSDVAVLTMQLTNFGITSLADFEEVQYQTKLIIRKIVLLYAEMKNRPNLMQWETEEGKPPVMSEVERRILVLIGVIQKSSRGLMHLAGGVSMCVPGYDITTFKDNALDGFECYIDEGLSPYQLLLAYLLDKAKSLGYRRYKGNCYRQIMSPTGHYDTCAWESVSNIEIFIYSSAQKASNFAQWKWMTSSPNNADHAKKYLENCVEYQFPVLIPDRHIFSFKNGVYIANSDYDGDKKSYSDKFYKYGAEDFPRGLVACNYFDLDFNDYESIKWFDIPTPNFQSILDFQDFGPEVCWWIFVLIGRLLYYVGELDRWQVIPFFKGLASSGKSTILLSVVKRFYASADVGILSNNIEAKFGLAAFADKYVFLAPEIKSDLKLEQAEFQSLCSGEDIQINKKHKTASPVEWNVPGALAGNEVPGWCDNSGSVTRRVVLLEFVKTVGNGDMNLSEKLEMEIPALLKKCNCAYLEARNRYGDKNIWTVLPEYFQGTQREMAQSCHALEHYLASDELEFGEDKYCVFTEFQAAFHSYCSQRHFDKVKFTKEYYLGAFAKRHLIGETKSSLRAWPRIRNTNSSSLGSPNMRSQRYLIGVDFVKEDYGAGPSECKLSVQNNESNECKFSMENHNESTDFQECPF